MPDDCGIAALGARLLWLVCAILLLEHDAERTFTPATVTTRTAKPTASVTNTTQTAAACAAVADATATATTPSFAAAATTAAASASHATAAAAAKAKAKQSVAAAATARTSPPALTGQSTAVAISILTPVAEQAAAPASTFTASERIATVGSGQACTRLRCSWSMCMSCSTEMALIKAEAGARANPGIPGRLLLHYSGWPDVARGRAPREGPASVRWALEARHGGDASDEQAARSGRRGSIVLRLYAHRAQPQVYSASLRSRACDMRVHTRCLDPHDAI